MVKLTWKHQAGCGDTHLGFANDIKLFVICWSLSKPRNDPNPYRLSSYLPGVESIYGVSPNELMIVAAKIFSEWLDRIGVREELT